MQYCILHARPTFVWVSASIRVQHSKMVKLLAAYTDEELLAGCVKNDRNIQQKFYERFYGKMMSLCSRYCNNKEGALELLNSGFLKVFLNIKSFKSQGSLEGWIRKVILNHILETHRKNIKYREMVEIQDKGHDVESNEDIISELNAEDIITMIGELPPSSRLVFNLFAIEGFSHKEISEKLKISTGTSKWHVSYARERLKKMFVEIKIKEDNYVSSR